MAYIVKWVVTDKSDTAYNSVSEFFRTGDEALVKQHTDIEVGFVLAKNNTLSEDGKSFVHEKDFNNEENYNTWLTEKEKLSEIDKHLTYTPI